MLVFGGETVQLCKLNDAWELDLKTFKWQQLSPPFFCQRRCDEVFGSR
jgi:hypothetical protein